MSDLQLYQLEALWYPVSQSLKEPLPLPTSPLHTWLISKVSSMGRGLRQAQTMFLRAVPPNQKGLCPQVVIWGLLTFRTSVWSYSSFLQAPSLLAIVMSFCHLRSQQWQLERGRKQGDPNGISTTFSSFRQEMGGPPTLPALLNRMRTAQLRGTPGRKGGSGSSWGITRSNTTLMLIFILQISLQSEMELE